MKTSSFFERRKARVDAGGTERYGHQIELLQQEGYPPLDIAAAPLNIAMEGEDEAFAQRAESTFQDRRICRKRASRRNANRRNWPRLQNRRSLDVRGVVKYVE